VVDFNVTHIRADFPILSRTVNGRPLVYLDNAATNQKPQVVIDAIAHYYANTNANIHRGVHALSQEATEAFENARRTVQGFFNIAHPQEVIFTAGTTHSINTVAHGYRSMLQAGDEIIVSEAEHHANIVPWQMLCDLVGSKLKVIPMTIDGSLDQEMYHQLLSSKTKIVVVNHVSNALGTINPIKDMIDRAHQVGAVVLIDGAQASSHIPTDLQALDADFYVTSAHKMCGPTGVGVLYGKKHLLEALPPYQGGGEMIKEVTFQQTTYAELPHKLEAGTPNISGVIAFGAAIEYLKGLGVAAIGQYEHDLLVYATAALKTIPGLTIYGDGPNKTAVLSFNIEGIHPYDIGTLLDQMGIAVRTGHHCAQPIMDYYKIPGTIRASLAFYNTQEEIDVFVNALKRAAVMLLG
jgi:cysteine desulfurase / selenocysteine lyase